MEACFVVIVNSIVVTSVSLHLDSSICCQSLVESKYNVFFFFLFRWEWVEILMFVHWNCMNWAMISQLKRIFGIICFRIRWKHLRSGELAFTFKWSLLIDANSQAILCIFLSFYFVFQSFSTQSSFSPLIIVALFKCYSLTFNLHRKFWYPTHTFTIYFVCVLEAIIHISAHIPTSYPYKIHFLQWQREIETKKIRTFSTMQIHPDFRNLEIRKYLGRFVNSCVLTRWMVYYANRHSL